MKIHKTFDKEELKALPSDQLDRMLHDELDKDQKDASLVLTLLNVLEEREAGEPAPLPGEAWQTFVERYNTKIEAEPAPPKKKPYRWLGAVAAALAVFVLASFAIPKVAGYDNIFTLIASWTDDFFTLSDPDDVPAQNEYVFKTDNPGLQQVYDAVVEIGITDPVVPMWIPEGYELVELKTVTLGDHTKVYARFIHNRSEIALNYKIYCEYQHSQLPKDEKNANEYEYDGTIYSIISNEENISAAWNKRNIACSFFTNEPKDILTKIIKSVTQ